MFAPTRLGWLENENRLSELCRDSADPSECRSRLLSPAVDIYTLRVAPDESSLRLGDLIVVATPGRGLSAHFHPAGASAVVDVVPDLYLQDWGYGPYFHQTFTERRGDWFLLPRYPWETEVWLHRPGQREGSSVLAVQAGDIIELRGSGMFVVDAEPDALTLRPEQPADFWCDEGAPPPLVDAEPIRISREDLVDGDGHLVIRPKYFKGC